MVWLPILWIFSGQISALTLMRAIAHGGCVGAIRESALTLMRAIAHGGCVGAIRECTGS